MSATHEVSIPDAVETRLHVDMKLWNLGQLMISAGIFSGQIFTRKLEHIRRDQIDHYLFFVQGNGQRLIQSGGREILLKPGDVAILEMATPSLSLASQGTSNSLYLPRDILREAFPNLIYPHGLVLRDGVGRLLGEHVQSMAAHLPTATHETLPYLVEATKNLAFASLASSQAQSGFDTLPLEAALRQKIERYIDANLGDRGLSTDSLCRDFSISRSTLYRLFDLHAGVANFIKRRRLLRIRSILLTADDTRPLSAIAESFGFSSGAHFSRSFREEFGCVPSDFRSQRSTTLSSNEKPSPIGLAAMFR